MNGRHLRLDTQIALAVTKVSEHGPYRVMDFPNVLTQERRRADPLDVAARVIRTRASDVLGVGWAGPVN
jgi:hypothetical protein